MNQTKSSQAQVLDFLMSFIEDKETDKQANRVPTTKTRVTRLLILDDKYAFGLGCKIKIILLFNLFLLLFMVLLYFLVLFIGSTVLFQLNFTFIYNTFSNKFSVLAK